MRARIDMYGKLQYIPVMRIGQCWAVSVKEERVLAKDRTDGSAVQVRSQCGLPS